MFKKKKKKNSFSTAWLNLPLFPPSGPQHLFGHPSFAVDFFEIPKYQCPAQGRGAKFERLGYFIYSVVERFGEKGAKKSSLLSWDLISSTLNCRGKNFTNNSRKKGGAVVRLRVRGGTVKAYYGEQIRPPKTNKNNWFLNSSPPWKLIFEIEKDNVDFDWMLFVKLNLVTTRYRDEAKGKEKKNSQACAPPPPLLPPPERFNP